jgi:hypothetical protein
MQSFGKDGGRADDLKAEFIRAMRKTLEWYEYPLVEPKVDGAFHAMLATIQLVSTTAALNAIASGPLTEEVVRDRINDGWQPFSLELLKQKQNSTLFWAAHEKWNAQLTQV